MISSLIAATLITAPVPADARIVVPGAINPNVTQANIHQTICIHGYTALPGVRPPASYTTPLKMAEIARRHLKCPYTRACEYDHDVPLELGGHPTSPLNLSVQRGLGDWNYHDKDRLENELHRLVCTGQVTLAQAQHEIATDWVASYRVRFRR